MKFTWPTEGELSLRLNIILNRAPPSGKIIDNPCLIIFSLLKSSLESSFWKSVEDEQMMDPPKAKREDIRL